MNLMKGKITFCSTFKMKSFLKLVSTKNAMSELKNAFRLLIVRLTASSIDFSRTISDSESCNFSLTLLLDMLIIECLAFVKSSVNLLFKRSKAFEH